MSQQKPTHDARVAGRVWLDSLLAIASFAVFFVIVRPHVSSDEPRTINVIAAYTAACMAGVFWLAWQMFRVVYRGQREDRASR